MEPLHDVLLVARRRAFWTTSFATALFPNDIMIPPVPGKVGYILHIPQIIFRILVTRPKLLILGTTMPYARWYAWAKRHGLFKKLTCVTDNQFLSSRDAAMFEAIWVYSKEEIMLQDEGVRDRFHFFPYPSSAQLVSINDVAPVPYPYGFCGGSHQRDFETFLQAVDGLSLRFILVTDKKIDTPIPHNMTLYGRMPMHEYMTFMAHAQFVVVPLKEGIEPHGHGDLASAFFLGKPVITTKGASVGDYVTDGVDGILVTPGSIEEYRVAIERLSRDGAFRTEYTNAARHRASQFSYEAFAKNLYELIAKMLTN